MHTPVGQPLMQASPHAVRAGSGDAFQPCRMALTRRGELQLPTGGAPGRMTSRQASFIVSGWESPGCLTGNLLRRRRTGPGQGARRTASPMNARPACPPASFRHRHPLPLDEAIRHHDPISFQQNLRQRRRSAPTRPSTPAGPTPSPGAALSGLDRGAEWHAGGVGGAGGHRGLRGGLQPAAAAHLAHRLQAQAADAGLLGRRAADRRVRLGKAHGRVVQQFSREDAPGHPGGRGR